MAKDVRIRCKKCGKEIARPDGYKWVMTDDGHIDAVSNGNNSPKCCGDSYWEVITG